MAVENLKSTIFGATVAGDYVAPDSAARDGHIRRIAGRVSNSAGANTGSKYLLCELPWSCILLSQTAFRTDNWGFAQAVIGTDEDPDGLLDAAKGASATGQLPITIFGAKWNKPFWAQMGLAAMPAKGAFARLYAVAEADATGAGTLDFDIQFADYI